MRCCTIQRLTLPWERRRRRTVTTPVSLTDCIVGKGTPVRALVRYIPSQSDQQYPLKVTANRPDRDNMIRRRVTSTRVDSAPHFCLIIRRQFSATATRSVPSQSHCRNLGLSLSANRLHLLRLGTRLECNLGCSRNGIRMVEWHRTEAAARAAMFLESTIQPMA
jgi:hypothetical protein